MTEVRLDDDIHWDGDQLGVWATAGDKRVFCAIPRETIHAIPTFNDALTREIARDRSEILDRLRPSILAKLAAADCGHVLIAPRDLVRSGARPV
jgi:hypothetical protein